MGSRGASTVSNPEVPRESKNSPSREITWKQFPRKDSGFFSCRKEKVAFDIEKSSGLGKQFQRAR